MNKKLIVVIMVVLGCHYCLAQTLMPSTKPNLAQQGMIKRGYGMFIHFGVNAFNEIEWSDGTLPVSSYNPTNLDPDQWVRVAIADSPNGSWKRFDEPVLETAPGTFYSFLTSNPSPIIEEDGSVTMIFKARNYSGNDKYSGMCFGLACAKTIYDKFEVLNNKQPVLGGPGQAEIEDPFFGRTRMVAT